MDLGPKSNPRLEAIARAVRRPAVRTGAVAAAALAVVLVPVFISDQYWLRLASLIGIYVLLGLGLNVVAGLAGLLDLGNVAFYALGAYAYALLASPQLGLHLSFPAVFAIALLVVAGVATVLGFSALRLYGDYLAIATLSFGQIVRLLLLNLDRPVNLTNGPNGIVRLDPFRLLPFVHGGPVVGNLTGFYYLLLAVIAVAGLMATRLVRSYVGRAWVALRDDPLAAAGSGVDLPRFKLGAYVFGACLAAAAGVLFAGWQAAVFPENFSLNEVINVYSVIILGGLGNLAGVIVGAAAVVLLPEFLRDYAIYRMLIYGFLLVVLVRVRPQGFLGARVGLGGGRRPVPPVEGVAADEPPPALDSAPGDPPAPHGPPVLDVCDLTVAFGGLTAVDGVSLTVHAGEIVGLIGPNGAGKTTLFNAISGFVRPSAGRILLRGRDIAGFPAQRVARLGLGRTFQAIRLFPGLSALENVAVGAHVRAGAAAGLLAGPRRLRTAEGQTFFASRKALGLVSPDFPGDPAAADVTALTYADRRRLEVARALAGDPSLLLLDEPAAGMSPGEADEVMRRLAELRAAGRAILLVEHRMAMVMGLCDRIVVLDHGRKLAEGTPGEVRTNHAVVEAYLGDDLTGESRPAAASERKTTAGSGGAHLRLERVSAGYSGQPVLGSVNLEASPGEMVCLLGANGSGKSTLLKTILGATDLTGGRVLLNDEDVSRLATSRIVARGVAVVLEGRRIFGRMTVEENLELMTGGQRLSSGERVARFDHVYELFPRLLERRSQLAGSLSGGEQQMLAIGRALMSGPRLLLLDEPTMGLAPKLAEATLQAVAAINHEGVTVVLAEQNAAALQVADRVYILEVGGVVASGAAQDVLRRDDIVQNYLGGRAAPSP
ncbi:MAG: branched-chain amino acid ABC transporter ATP-binding protein/permease [Bacillota bacterium]